MKKVMIEFMAVGFAGALGAMLRLAVARIFSWSTFPIGTLIINLAGSLFLGWFLTIIGERISISETMRLAIAVGFVGAFTTFSTYLYESHHMYENGAEWRAILYLAGSIALGLIAVRAGILLGKN